MGRKTKKIEVLKRPKLKAGLNQIEMLWHDPKQTTRAQRSFTVTELKQFSKKQWARIPLIPQFKHLAAVLLA